jgi:hypothetical protein
MVDQIFSKSYTGFRLEGFRSVQVYWVSFCGLVCFFLCILLRVKYQKAPKTTTRSPDVSPNYQCLQSGPLNYQLLVF